MGRHALYDVWKDMRRRCSNPRAAHYKYYGARGIKMCADWEHFWTFVFDMGVRPEGYSVDRIDNDGPYAPWNCRWASRFTQQRNSRHTHYITHDGETLCVAEWAARFGVTQSAICHRIAKHGAQRAIAIGKL